MTETTNKQGTDNNETISQKPSDVPLPPSEQSKISFNQVRRPSGKMGCDKSQMSMTYNHMKFSAPPDFRELLAELTKTVLEEQPSDIPRFLARYFRELHNDSVFQQQKDRIQKKKEEAERVERERIEAIRQAEIRKKRAAMALRAKKLAIMKANILAEAERQRLEDERLAREEEEKLQESASYISNEIIKQAMAVRLEQHLRDSHEINLERLEEEKSIDLHKIDLKIESLENQTVYLDECMDTIYNRQMLAHEESLNHHKAKLEEYRKRVIELEEFISNVSGIIEKLNLEKPKLEAERVSYIQGIEQLHIDKTEAVKAFNLKIIDLEVKFKNDLEEIHKFLT